jgi:hypothetical protein
MGKDIIFITFIMKVMKPNPALRGKNLSSLAERKAKGDAWKKEFSCGLLMV